MTPSVSPRSGWTDQAPSLMLGALLGALVWQLGRMPEPTTFRLAMGMVLFASGAASFVMFRLHRKSRSARVTRQAMAREVRASLVWLGCGTLAALHALPTLFA